MIGEKLGKYTLLETVGAGSMGTVYKAEDPEGHIVAVKLVRSQVLYDADRRERFLQGILPVCLFRHDGICPILEIGDDNDDFFIVMPFIEGKTLEQCLEHKPLHWRRALGITHSVADALAAAHASGAVHRGLKPSNIWIKKDGSVLVSDCAIARFTELARATRAKSAGSRVASADTLIPLAALAYMSPEQVRGDLVDVRTDVFSLGSILYEMLTGRHPFDARNTLSRMSAILEAEPSPPSSRLGSIPGDLNRIVQRAMAKEPTARYANMHEFLADLDAARKITDEDGTSLQQPGKRRRFRLAGWIAVIVVIIALVSSLLYFVRRA